MAENQNTAAAPSFWEAFGVWLKIGLLSFGGPAGQIALMHKILVEERRWIDEPRFLHALNYCMLLPGPEAQQLATYIGWLLNRTIGGLIAGLLFVLPGAMVILALSIAYALYAQIPLVAAAFVGVKAAVLIVVVEAVLRIGKRALKTAPMYLIACIAFLGIFLFAIPFPIIILGAALIGLIGGIKRPDLFVVIKGKSADGDVSASVVATMAARGELSHTQPSTLRSVLLLIIFGVLWGGPVAALFVVFGEGNVFAEEAAFFSKLAVVTFGGAYAVLAYMAQQAVETYGWLTGAEMLDGLGLAETTPGPLILVTEFVGFLAGYKNAGLIYGIFGAAIALWATFIPCFLWIFAGATYLDWLAQQPRLSRALTSIMAAVVGVIANLFTWFALHLFFDNTTTLDLNIAQILVPNFASLDLRVTAITVVCGWLALGRQVGVPRRTWTPIGRQVSAKLDCQNGCQCQRTS